MLKIDDFNLDVNGWEPERSDGDTIPEIKIGDWMKIVVRSVQEWEIGTATSYSKSAYGLKVLQIKSDGIEGKIVSAPDPNTVSKHVRDSLFIGQEVSVSPSLVHQVKSS